MIEEKVVDEACCGYNGHLHYQRRIRENEKDFRHNYRAYCLLNSDECPYANKVIENNGVERYYCNAPLDVKKVKKSEKNHKKIKKSKK